MHELVREIHALGEKVGTVIGKVDGLEKDISNHESHIRELRQPSRQPMLVQGGIALFLLTVIGLLYTSLDARVETANESDRARDAAILATIAEHESRGREFKSRTRKHAGDGHSAHMVDEHLQQGLKALERERVHLKEHISIVDKLHASEHVEQEEDIDQLRQVNQRVEERLDKHAQRLAVLETKQERVVGHSAQGFHQKDWQQVGEPLIRRIERLEMSRQ